VQSIGDIILAERSLKSGEPQERELDSYD